MRRLAYGTALTLGLLAATPVLVPRLARGRYRAITAARLGLGRLPDRDAAGCIWVHALSVGEVGSALPLLAALGERFPGAPLCLSVATAQGLAVARQSLDGGGVHLMVRPLDVPWAVGRVLRRLRPRLAVLVEGDIWPGWQWGLGDMGAPRLLVNNRVSPRTYRGYRRLGPMARALFAGFERVLVQTKVDYERLRAVGVDKGRLAIGGNLKFDSAPEALTSDERAALAEELGLSGRDVLVAGSTHPGEDEPVLEAFAILAQERPGLTLVLAPREVDRGAELERLARQRGLSAARASAGPAPEDCRVLVLDVLGKLARVYALGRAAFVGGSLVGVGGHNLLEPAAQGVPVVFGPVTHNFKQMAEDLIEAGGGRRIADGAGLLGAWGGLLEDAESARDVGHAGREFCRAHRGAVARAVDEAARLMGEA